MNKNSSIIHKLISTILVIWLLLSIIGFAVMSIYKNYSLTGVIFGQLFIVIGLIALTNKGIASKIVGTVITLTGTVIIVIFYKPLHSYIVNMFSISDEMLTLLLIVAFLSFCDFIAVICLIYSFILKARAKRDCSFEISARIIDIKKHSSDDCYVYTPIYEYYYRGNIYKQSSKFSSSTLNYKIGDNATLFINPNNPEKFYELKRNVYHLYILAAAFFVVIISLTLFALLKTGITN